MQQRVALVPVAFRSNLVNNGPGSALLDRGRKKTLNEPILPALADGVTAALYFCFLVGAPVTTGVKKYG